MSHMTRGAGGARSVDTHAARYSPVGCGESRRTCTAAHQSSSTVRSHTNYELVPYEIRFTHDTTLYTIHAAPRSPCAMWCRPDATFSRSRPVRHARTHSKAHSPCAAPTRMRGSWPSVTRPTPCPYALIPRPSTPHAAKYCREPPTMPPHATLHTMHTRSVDQIHAL